MRPELTDDTVARTDSNPSTRRAPFGADEGPAAGSQGEKLIVPPSGSEDTHATSSWWRRVVRGTARALLWPFTRFFDPRFQGLSAQADAYHEDLVQHAEIIRGEVVAEVVAERPVAAERHAELIGRSEAAAAALGRLEHLYRLHIDAYTHHLDASNEATELLGRSLSDLLREADALRADLERTADDVRDLASDTRGLYVERATNRPVDDLDGRVAHLLNYAAGHRGFAAQRGLWFNPPISLSYREGDVTPSSSNERIVETPYVLRALGQLGPGGRILDVGAVENTLAFSLASLGYEVTALDLRPYPLEHRRLTSVVAPIQDWETDEQFDAVLLLSTLEHIGLGAYGDDPIPGRADVDALDRIRELTTSGGLLVLTAPYGAESADELQRSYDGRELRSMLASWEIVDFTVARRTDELAWEIDQSPPDGAGDDVERVALITATLH